MKKSNQYSKNQLAKQHLKNILLGNQYSSIILLCIYILIYFSITFFSFTIFDIFSLPQISSISSDLDFYMANDINSAYYIFSQAENEALLTFLLGGVFAYVNFYYMFSKSSLTNRLSIAVSRGRQYFNSTFYHLAILTLVIIIVKSITLYLNYSTAGASQILLPAFFANLTQMITIMIFGFFVVSTGAILSGNYLEWGVTALSLAFVVKAILSNINMVFDYTLHGFDGTYYIYSEGANEITEKLRLFDPTLAWGYFENFTSFWRGDVSIQVAYDLIIRNVVFFVVLIICFVAVGKYFSKYYKPENCHIRGANKFTTTLWGVFATTCISIFILSLLRENQTPLSPKSPKLPFIGIYIISLLAGAIISYLITLTLTFKPKNSFRALKGTVISGVITIFVIIIGYSGCFGFTEKTPALDEIKLVRISQPFEFVDNFISNTYFENNNPFEGAYLTLETKNDIEFAYELNRQLSKSTKTETSISTEITFILKDGTEVTRTYRNLENDDVNTFLKLWETDEIRNIYKAVLCTETERIGSLDDCSDVALYAEHLDDGTAIYTFEDSETIYTYSTTVDDEYVLPLGTKDVYLLSKDNRLTFCKEYTDAFCKELRYAIYKDICNMSAMDWFSPDKQLGVIGFSSANISQSIFDDGFDQHIEPVFDGAFHITPKMTNTINVLKNHNYYNLLDCNRKIEKAYTVDALQVVEWYMLNNGYCKALSGGKTLHSPYAEWDAIALREYVDYCILGRTQEQAFYYIDNKIPLPHATEISLQEATDIIDESFTAYNMGDHGKFLITIFENEAYNILLLPQK